MDFQGQKIVLHDVPDQRVGDAMVLVPKHVADTHNLRPRDVWLARLEFRRNTAGGLGDNLDTALNAMSKKPVRAKIVPGPSLLPLPQCPRSPRGLHEAQAEQAVPSKDTLGRSFDAVLEQRIQTVSGGYIDMDAKAALQKLSNADQSNEREATAAIIVDEKIKVALRTRLIARG
jgi:hypothetical protein